MKLLEFRVGDPAWIYMGAHRGETAKGTVVAILDLEGWGFRHYVVEIPTSVDPLLEVRSGLSMSDAAGEPIGFWRS